MKVTAGKTGCGFTLVEVLVSATLISLLLLVLVSMTDSTTRMWSYTSGRIEQFRDAREGFESITRRLSQATLNTYWDYQYPNGDTTQPPLRYSRQSELRFRCGNARQLTGNNKQTGHAAFFQGPLGFSGEEDYTRLENLLNTWGYYVEYGDDLKLRPDFLTPESIPPRNRFRLMELMEPSDRLTLYQFSSGNPAYKGSEWFTQPLQNGHSRVLAENIVGLILLPTLSPDEENSTGRRLAPNYSYDSAKTDDNNSASVDPELNWKNQLPPIVQVTLVAVDEGSFRRLNGASALMPEFFIGCPFDKAIDYTTDLDRLESNLRDWKLSYRVFVSNVSIRAAKWSREQRD